MPLLSWLSPFTGKNELQEDALSNRSGSLQTEETLAAYVDFEALAEKVDELRYELDRARDMCEQANIQFDKYRLEIYNLKQRLDLERDACIKAHRIVFNESNHNNQLRARNRDLQTSLKRQTVHSAQLEARLATETSSLRAMTKHARTQEERLIDTQLDLEYLRCTTSDARPSPSLAAVNNDAPLPAQPFVVVLVDGDAYKWSPDIALNDRHLGIKPTSYNVDGTTAGAMAATRIRNEVTKYILNQEGTIPITSKIVTRGFCNFSMLPGSKGSTWRQNGSGGVGLAEFALQVTEKLPLFDFFDAGRGKERADDKIRGRRPPLTMQARPRTNPSTENFHLYLSTPNCHAIFLAACLDNGFARMLEQYNDHPIARQKIVLVSPGYVAIEIQRLGFTETQWPSVFAHQTPPPAVAANFEKEKTRIKLQRARVQRSASTPLMGGDNTTVLPKLLNMVPAWTPWNKAPVGIGMRIPPSRGAALESLDLAEIEETSEEVD
ncbi:hypothetical protein H2200_006138 [Cladophialophora chaetospira]|uniref:DUF7923 domain-containing protein n=1 Tax=Cladophialophora chaetospira TaxID=386627 RepID=A0AA39CIU5_9EURO|nr:hypothetical protein H2200_006138 [Cladophialophora chaetospira]